jgi:putative oxidoreductase
LRLIVGYGFVAHGVAKIKLRAVTSAGARFGPPGCETDVLYLAALAARVLGGSGPLALHGKGTEP